MKHLKTTIMQKPKKAKYPKRPTLPKGGIKTENQLKTYESKVADYNKKVADIEKNTLQK